MDQLDDVFTRYIDVFTQLTTIMREHPDPLDSAALAGVTRDDLPADVRDVEALVTELAELEALVVLLQPIGGR